MDYIRGFDLSHWNNAQTYLMAKKNSGFYILKATQGTKYVDSTFNQRAKDLILEGRRVGFYHYITDADVYKQVVHFWNTVKSNVELVANWNNNPNIPILFFVDWEEANVTLANVKVFCESFRQLSGYKPIIYTCYSWYKIKKLEADNLHQYWISGYTKIDTCKKRVEQNDNIVLYQYTDYDDAHNVSLDCDWWIPSRREWVSRYEKV